MSFVSYKYYLSNSSIRSDLKYCSRYVHVNPLTNRWNFSDLYYGFCTRFQKTILLFANTSKRIDSVDKSSETFIDHNTKSEPIKINNLYYNIIYKHFFLRNIIDYKLKIYILYWYLKSFIVSINRLIAR